MNTLSALLRNVVVLMLALAGIALAFVFMVATAIALGVMYLVARIRGKPFPLVAMWQARRGAQWRFVRTPGAPDTPSGHDMPGRDSGPARRPAIRRHQNVTDVEARDVH